MQIQKELLVGSVIALGIAVLPMPYAYYMLLRVGMCGVLAYLTFKAARSQKEGLSWILGAAAVLYNPFVPVHLNKELWILINLGTIGLFAYIISLTKSFSTK